MPLDADWKDTIEDPPWAAPLRELITRATQRFIDDKLPTTVIPFGSKFDPLATELVWARDTGRLEIRRHLPTRPIALLEAEPRLLADAVSMLADLLTSAIFLQRERADAAVKATQSLLGFLGEEEP